MKIADLGYTDALENYRIEQNLESFEVGRVISEHKERYIVKTHLTEYDAELIGKLRFASESRYDLPAVGDWVAFSEYDERKALIHAIFPRSSILERQAVSKSSQIQIIATNLDFGLIVQSADRDFNLNRLERYLTICHDAKIHPIAVLSKTDLISNSDLQQLLKKLRSRISGLKIISVSNQKQDGYADLSTHLEKGKTYCLLGSSGVGKSTLLNAIAGHTIMDTREISASVHKGKHTTSHRELVLLENGSILIDNPGMREVGIANFESGLETTFDAILKFAGNCQFSDCTHIQEKGCAILEALETGEIDEESYANYRRMERERAYFESTLEERRMKEREMGKFYKSVIKHKKQTKY